MADEAVQTKQDDAALPAEISSAEREEMLTEARERFKHIQDVDEINRRMAREDAEFVWLKGAQWPQGIVAERDKDWQPCLEASQLTQFIKQVVNDQRQNRPGVKVSAASGDASVETAKILQGMVRHIEYDSRAEAIYDTAFEHAVTSGRGYWRIVSDYESPTSFNQKLVIKSVPDFQSVYMDPDYQEPDASDVGYCFVTEKMGKKAFEAAYPHADPVNWEEQDAGWFPERDQIIIADYYRRVCKKRTLCWLSNGAVAWKDDFEKLPIEGVTIAREREADSYSVEWFKLAGGRQVLEQYGWKGTMIPVVQDPGDEITLNGRRIFQGLIRRVRDLQMSYNFLISAAMERVALAPKSPWVMAEGQDEGYENDWNEANRRPFSRLIYKPTTVDGQLAPPPQRQMPVQAEMGLFQQAEAIKQDIKSVLGMYENSLGMRSQEVSGRAIIAREKQGDNATFNYVDNLSRAIAHTGRIILELIPHYYDTQRVVGMVQDDDTKTTTTINQDDPYAAIAKNDVRVGKYAVAVEAGPSYATQRKETAELTAQLVQSYPPLMQFAGDLVVKAQELPDADAFAERFRLMLPPPIQQMLQAKEKNQAPPDPAMLAQMQQMQQQLQMAQQAMQAMQQELQAAKAGAQEKMAAAQIDAQADVEKANLDAQTDLQRAQIQAQTAIEKAQIEAQTKLLIAQVSQPAPGAEGAPGLDAEPDEGVQSSEAILVLAQQLGEMARVLAAPRQMAVQTDAAGNVVGGVSEVIQ